LDDISVATGLGRYCWPSSESRLHLR
jgi:hypothetical protein